MIKNHFSINSKLILAFGAIAIAFAGLNWHLGIAAWLAPAFLLYYTRNSSWKGCVWLFILLSISGAISQTGNNIFHVFIINIFNGISFGIVYTLIYILDKILYKKNGSFFYTLIFPSLIVLLEFISSSLVGTWGALAHTQYPNITLMQIASVTGLFSITFVVSWFGSTVNWIYENRSSTYRIRMGAGVYGGIIILVLIFGIIRIPGEAVDTGTIRVATIVGIADIQKIAEQEQDSLKVLIENPETKLPQRIFSSQNDIDEMLSRTIQTIDEGADIIAWNEDALILNSVQKESILDSISKLCISSKVYILTAFLEENISTAVKPFNNVAIMLNPSGNIDLEYLKSYLHPYGEVPIINPGDYTLPFIDTKYGRVGVVICADLDMSKYIFQTSENDIDLLLVPSYDWKGITPLHSHMACVEAIQNGITLVRANGKGVSAIYDPYGRVLAQMNTFESDEKMLLTDIPLTSVSTIYSKIGSSFAYICILFLLFIAGIRIFGSEKLN